MHNPPLLVAKPAIKTRVLVLRPLWLSTHHTLLGYFIHATLILILRLYTIVLFQPSQKVGVTPLLHKLL